VKAAWFSQKNISNKYEMEIIQIVHYLPPAISGVGDYALVLARELRRVHDIQTVFVVCDPNWENAEILKTETLKPPVRSHQSAVSGLSTINHQPSTTLDGFPVYQLITRSAKELLRVLSQPEMPTTVLLQYAGYGYQKRGCPVWLVRALRAWHKSGNATRHSPPATRLLTMFHELYAFGPPWRSSFWTSPLQRWIARSLACLSGHCFTNMNQSARTLQEMAGRNTADFTILPVISNVGEPKYLPAWDERRSKMIVFGNVRRRRTIYSEHKAALEKACLDLGLTEIVDIGPPCEIPQLSVRCRPTGSLLAQEVSREMLSARAGFFALPIEFLGKSGTYAAYAAHGLLPVTHATSKDANEDGLKSGEHLLTIDQLSRYDSNQIRHVCSNACKWYRSHEVCEQAANYAKSLKISLLIEKDCLAPVESGRFRNLG
jgi:hypothetical protein